MVINGKILDKLKAEQSRFDGWMGGLRERWESRMPPRILALGSGCRCYLLSSAWLKGD